MTPNGPVVLGICGGFQMLGVTRVDDPRGVESPESLRPRPRPPRRGSPPSPPTKERHRVAGRILEPLPAGQAFLPARHGEWQAGMPAPATEGGCPISGYEIHMGTYRAPTRDLAPWIELTRQSDGVDRCSTAPNVPLDGRAFGTYVHGLFDSLTFCRGLVGGLRTTPPPPPPRPRPVGGPPRGPGGSLRAPRRAYSATISTSGRSGRPSTRGATSMTIVTQVPGIDPWVLGALPLGVALDLALGDPRGWPHPVRAGSGG